MSLLKSYLPKWLLNWLRPHYHRLAALAANYYFNQPSKEMTVIGITGTAGKSTTVYLLARLLNAAGKKCGYITTVGFSDGSVEELNKHGLSMPGGWLLQKQLRRMRDSRCQLAIIECTSEGLNQNRHAGIDFDYAVFTNLSAAHLEAHGGWENYKAAKGKLFAVLGVSQTGVAKKTIVANLDDDNAGYFLNFPAQQKSGITFLGRQNSVCQKIFSAQLTEAGFGLNGQNFKVNLLGEFNRYNALLAVVCAESLGVALEKSAGELERIAAVPGRMEVVPNSKNITVIVDYGCEPASFTAALAAASALPHKKLIHIFGATGGHRDTAKRALFGAASAKAADIIIITNDDVYDSDPRRIAEAIEAGVKQQKQFQGTCEIILDRRQAIARGLRLAQEGDLVLVTGKGSEQFLILSGNQRVAWDDREVVKEELRSMN